MYSIHILKEKNPLIYQPPIHLFQNLRLIKNRRLNSNPFTYSPLYIPIFLSLSFFLATIADLSSESPRGASRMPEIPCIQQSAAAAAATCDSTITTTAL